MLKTLRTSAFAVVAASASIFGNPERAEAYQVDCAILLCLSGGWPASAPCAHARAVFIRRITPWPISPPLQIWRCPMSMSAGDQMSPSQSFYDMAFKDAPPSMVSYPEDDYYFDTVGANPYNHPRDTSTPAIDEVPKITAADLRTKDGEFDAMAFLHLTQEQRADIDISGPEFDFVRSIVVWDVRHYSYRERGRDDECGERYHIFKGTYGTQGQFSYRTARIGEVPTWAIPRRSCRPASSRRGVGVEWRSFEGIPDSEWVSY